MVTGTAHAEKMENSAGWQASNGFNRGSVNDTVSQQWRNRPVDECFLNLDDMYDVSFAAAQKREERQVTLSGVGIYPDGSGGVQVMTGDGNQYQPTHWAFSQLSQLAGAPSSFLRKLNPETATQAFNEAWTAKHTCQSMKFYQSTEQVHSVTSTSYGRLNDYAVIDAVRDIAGSGQGEKHWKVPGKLDWSTGRYEPDQPVTAETTTLFSSDRDVFMFLVDDTRPIEIGRLPSGDPDNVFRGFYVWNSEMGLTTLGCATSLLRGVCGNRILWGCENHQEIRIRHNQTAPRRFMEELAPALRRYAEASESDVLYGIKNAQSQIVVDKIEDRVGFLRKRRFSKPMAEAIIEQHIREEHFAPVSAWDFVQAITAYAKKIPYQDKRVAMEKRAASLMEATV